MNKKQYYCLIAAMLITVIIDILPSGRPSSDYDSIKWRLADIIVQSRTLSVMQMYQRASVVSIIASIVGVAFLFRRKSLGIWLYSLGVIIQISCYLIIPVYLLTGIAMVQQLIFFTWSGFAIALLTVGPARSFFLEEKEQADNPSVNSTLNLPAP